MIVNCIGEVYDKMVFIVGKCCESGDMLIWDIDLLEVKEGDFFVVFCIGVYGYSMVNNYNWILRFVVVFVENGEDYLVVKWEIYEDIVKFDLFFKMSVK